MRPQTKKQHFVPQFYLQRFSANGKSLWVFDRRQKRLYPTNIKDACSEKDLYESLISRPLMGENPFIFPNEIENQLSREESKYASVLRSLIKRDPGAYIPKTEQKSLTEFIAHLIGRNAYTLSIFIPVNPAELLENNNEYQVLLEDIGLGSATPALCDQAAKRVLTRWRHVGTPQQAIIANLKKLHLTILQAPPDAELITSSFPALMTIKPNYEQEDHLTCLYLPLSQSRAALYTTENNQRSIPLSSNDVNAFNRQYFSENHPGDKVIASHVETLQQVLLTSPSVCYDKHYCE